MDVKQAIENVGLTRVAKACNVSPASAHKWKTKNRLPRTDWTGETRYAEVIAGLHGGITADELLKIP